MSPFENSQPSQHVLSELGPQLPVLVILVPVLQCVMNNLS